VKLSALVAALSCAAAVSPFVPSASAASPPVLGVSSSSVAESADFASEVLADPWDFSTTTDVAGPASMAASLLTYAPSSKVQPTLVASTASSQAWGRDGRVLPVDADRFTVLSLRLWSSAQSSGGVSWTTCGWATVACRGFMAFTMTAGWRTYDLVIKSSNLSSSPAAWAGKVTGMRLTGAAGPTVKVDWARLREAAQATVDISWDEPTAGETVYWDLDGDSSNNTYDDPGTNTKPSRGWGIAGQAFGGGTRTAHVPMGAFPPGAFRFYVPYTGGEMSTTITVRARPRPVVLTPSASQGADWATTVRKNPFDMAQTTDYTLKNARVVGNNGRWFAAENTSNDPSVYLPIKPFLGSTYHRVQVKMALLGAYSLANAPGGGCIGRILWTTSKGGPTKWPTTDDLVLYPGWNAIDLDMATSPATAIVDPAIGANRIGWAGQTITQLRFDPNEDPGKRRWYLDDIRVAADPVAGKGRFDFKFNDFAGSPGTTAKVEAVGPGNQVYVVADGYPVAPGTNTVSWLPAHDVPVALYRFRVTLTNDAGSVTKASPVPVKVVPA
jgi:hypothetical protein